MINLSNIEDALTGGHNYYMQLMAEYRIKLIKGCDDCRPVDMVCLSYLILAITADVKQGLITFKTILLYKKLLDLLKGRIDFDIPDPEPPVSETFTLRWGIYDTRPEAGSLVFGFSKQVPVGSSNYSITFPNEVFDGAKFIAIQQPASETVKSYFVNDSVFNKGAIPGVEFLSWNIIDTDAILVSRNAFVFSENKPNIIFYNTAP